MFYNMHWQDFVLTIGQILFIIALIPSLTSKHKPAFKTSLINGVVLILFACTYISLSLTLGAIGTFITGVLWLILAYQKFRMEKVI